MRRRWRERVKYVPFHSRLLKPADAARELVRSLDECLARGDRNGDRELNRAIGCFDAAREVMTAELARECMGKLEHIALRQKKDNRVIRHSIELMFKIAGWNAGGKLPTKIQAGMGDGSRVIAEQESVGAGAEVALAHLESLKRRHAGESSG